MKQTKTSSWDFLWYALYAFAGLGLEFVLIGIVESLLFGKINANDYSASQRIIHWILTSVCWGITAGLLIKASKNKSGFNVLSCDEVKKKNIIFSIAAVAVCIILNFVDWKTLKELGILKALGYSDINVAKHFWVFGTSVFVGTAVGYTAAFIYMPTFYDAQNNMEFFPQMQPEFHFFLAFSLIALPTLFFMLLAVLYAFFKIKSPVLGLLKEAQNIKIKTGKADEKDLPFLTDLKNNTLKSRKILVFFVGFSAFCFSAMTQMSMSMDDLSSETFSFMIISIGLILAFMTLLMSLTSVVKSNTKTIAMMKVFGYSRKECSSSILGGYRPVSYVGFVIGTVYQYLLLRIVVDVVFADFENMPEFSFNFKALAVSLVTFIAAYEIIIYCYSRKISGQSVKSIMLE